MIYWSDGRAPKKIQPLATALAKAQILGLLDLDGDGRLEPIARLDTPSGVGVVAIAVSDEGWYRVGSVDLDPNSAADVRMHMRPLPVRLPRVKKAKARAAENAEHRHEPAKPTPPAQP